MGRLASGEVEAFADARQGDVDDRRVEDHDELRDAKQDQCWSSACPDIPELWSSSSTPLAVLLQTGFSQEYRRKHSHGARGPAHLRPQKRPPSGRSLFTAGAGFEAAFARSVSLISANASSLKMSVIANASPPQVVIARARTRDPKTNAGKHNWSTRSRTAPRSTSPQGQRLDRWAHRSQAARRRVRTSLRRSQMRTGAAQAYRRRGNRCPRVVRTLRTRDRSGAAR